MALSIPSTTEVFEEKPSQYYLLPTTTIEQENNEFKRKESLRLDTIIDTRSWFSSGDGQLHLRDTDKIKSTGFSFNNPWLPPDAYKILNKLKKGPITERELIKLMELVAECATDHFQLNEGKFVAMTFHGRVVEASDTRIGLLKKIQGRKYREQIFVWRVGFNSFSGRV